MKNLPAQNKTKEEERLQKQWYKELRNLKIGRAKAGVFKAKIIESYSIIDDLRFDYLGDTAFRDKVTDARKALEETVNDFLLSDNYWEQKIKKFVKNTPEEYDEYLDGMKDGQASIK